MSLANILPNQIPDSLYVKRLRHCKFAKIFLARTLTIDSPKFYHTRILRYTILLKFSAMLHGETCFHLLHPVEELYACWWSYEISCS